MRTAITYLLILLVSLALAEGLLRIADPVVLRPGYNKLGIWEENDKDTGFYIKPKSNFATTFFNQDFTTTIETNNMGWREPADYADEPIDLAVMGDSFAFGHGVAHGRRFGDVIREESGLHGFTYSYANGWAPPHYRVYLEQNPHLIPRDHLVISLYPWNDLRADMAETHLEWTSDGKRLKRVWCERALSAEGYFIRLDEQGGIPLGTRLAGVLDDSALGRLAIRIAQGLLTAGRVYAERPVDTGRLTGNARKALDHIVALSESVRSTSGAQVLVLLVPPPYWVSSRYDRFCPYASEKCRRIRREQQGADAIRAYLDGKGITLVDPLERLREADRARPTYLVHDGHWTARGHRVAAGAVLDAM